MAGEGQGPKKPPGIGDLFWIGTACAISILGGGGLGYLADVSWNTLPWGTVGGLAFGVMSAVLIAVKELRKYV